MAEENGMAADNAAVPVQTKYPASEIAAAADTIFKKKYTRALVLTALYSANLGVATIEEARAAVEKFANKKVREEQ